MTDFKDGDWVVCDQRIGQLRRIDGKFAELADGMFCLSGHILDECRPLTLRNKAITESIECRYSELRKMDGSGVFNFPDINRHFWQLALSAIDDEPNEKKYHDMANEFVNQARDCKKEIQGISLFRRAG